MSEEEDIETRVERELFNRKPKPGLSISEGVEGMRSAELPEEQISDWVEGKVRKQFRFPPEK